MNYALIRDGIVDNVVVWDGETPWEPPAGLELVALDDGTTAGPGWTYDGTTFTAPDPGPSLGGPFEPFEPAP